MRQGLAAAVGLTALIMPGLARAQATEPAPPPPATLRPLIAIPDAPTGVASAPVPAETVSPVPGGPGSGPIGGLALPPRDLTALSRLLPIRRQLPIAAIRAIPQVSLGAATVNFTPVLQNPAALFNVASRLRSLPQLARVERDEADVVEIDEGLLVRSALRYQIQPGACARPEGRLGLEAAGSGCFRRTPVVERLAALANPVSPAYVADPEARASAIAAYQGAVSADHNALQAQAAEARAGMVDPSRRAALVARLGAAEVERLSRLSQDQLVEDMVNAGEVEVEQVLFVPRLEATTSFPRLAAINPMVFDAAFLQRVGAGRTQAILDAVTNPAFQQALEAYNARHEPMTRELGPFVFLTGFTLGKTYEWQTRVQYKVDPCRYIPFKDPCRKTYYLEPYAKLGYGFGLRFPVEVSASYSYPAFPGRSDKARLVLDYRPINGTRAQYETAGLSADKLFEGKELVAEFEATAGFRYKVPFRQGDFSVGIAKDFTDGLPAPFARGQFRPPAPGAAGLDAFTRTFTEFDLLGGRGNYGFVGVTVYPAIRVDLASSRLDLTLTDHVAQRDLRFSRSGQSRVISVDAEGVSRFAIGSPVYNLSFKVTPGIEARAFVDVAVWEKRWNWPVWFPEIAVELPPAGVDFACHAGTRCLRNSSVRAWRAPQPAAGGNR